MSIPAYIAGARAARNGIRLGGPLAAGALALALLGCTGVLAARSITLPGGMHMVEASLAARRLHPLTHAEGRISAVHVQLDQKVAAGDLLATIESNDLDSRIAALKAQSDAAQLQLQSVRREAKAFNTLLEQRLVSRQRVEELERQVAELERKTAAVLARAAAAETEVFDTEIRAPISGVIESMQELIVGQTVAPGDVLGRIAPDENVVVLEAHLSPAKAKAAQNAGWARVWLGTASWRDARPLEARLTWLSPAGAAGADHIAHFELVRVPSPKGDTPPFVSSQRATVSIPARGTTVLQTLLEPFRRRAGEASAT